MTKTIEVKFNIGDTAYYYCPEKERLSKTIIRKIATGDKNEIIYYGSNSYYDGCINSRDALFYETDGQCRSARIETLKCEIDEIVI